jgi:hypothetical protein
MGPENSGEPVFAVTRPAIKLGRTDCMWHQIQKKFQPQMNMMYTDEEQKISPAGVAGRQIYRF